MQQDTRLLEPSATEAKPSLIGLPAEGVQWHFDDSGYYSYLLITADDSVRNGVLEALRAKRYGTTTGPSQRPANDRIQYSHYIRVTRGGIPGKVKFDEIRDFLLSLLGPTSTTVPSYSRPFPNIVVLPRKQVSDISKPSLVGAEDLSSLQHALEKMTEDRDLYRSLFEESTSDSTVEELRRELGDLKRTINYLTAQNEELSEDLERAHENINAIQEWRDAQQNEAAQQVAVRSVAWSEQSEPSVDLFQTVIKVLLPRIELHPGAISQLQHEIERPDLVLSLLAKINNDLIRWDDSVRGAPGWLEQRFTKHRNVDGRLYAFRRSNGSWLIYLSDKQNQKTDIAKLKVMTLHP